VAEVIYQSTSPYSSTAQGQESLDILNTKLFAFEPDDLLYEIDSFYAFRPDLLAFDLYGSSKLWWVFMHRNMDTITDPIYSFTAGTEIRIPKKPTLEKYLGV
jgi:hypothetical protein